MTEKIYYLERTDAVINALNLIINEIPCFVENIPVEMNYIKTTICARTEDISYVENILAPYI